MSKPRDDGAEALRGRDRLQAGDPGAEDQHLGRRDRAGGGGHHREEAAGLARGEQGRGVAGDVRLRGERVHRLGAGDPRDRLHREAGHARRRRAPCWSRPRSAARGGRSGPGPAQPADLVARSAPRRGRRPRLPRDRRSRPRPRCTRSRDGRTPRRHPTRRRRRSPSPSATRRRPGSARRGARDCAVSLGTPIVHPVEKPRTAYRQSRRRLTNRGRSARGSGLDPLDLLALADAIVRIDRRPIAPAAAVDLVALPVAGLDPVRPPPALELVAPRTAAEPSRPEPPLTLSSAGAALRACRRPRPPLTLSFPAPPLTLSLPPPP